MELRDALEHKGSGVIWDERNGDQVVSEAEYKRPQLCWSSNYLAKIHRLIDPRAREGLNSFGF